ncbi:DUF2752 domain-containing protein [Acinetobacter sp. ACZLY 512]|uniref:DUF2752 domain-containing protein n=1 Tax=Acinetobacter sp. ACZLY 512 TaxID=2911206 RepID=UPI0020267293|nr:DUF2752 domain-containing protein [Acinetobacter sp. ACZLY 512]MCL9676941.1 DUF2752 domain-containing protein [Acinetobacter sp. ACZLY 512]
MKTRCPACGATSSIDALLGYSEASQAFKSCLGLVGELQTPLVKYLALFRPDSRDLTFDRAAKLLNELAPDIVAKQIQRNRQTFPAPLGAWVWAIGVVLERRDQGKIDLPLKSHGYLYEVISSYKPEYAPVQDSTPRKHAGVRAAHTTYSKTDAQLAADQAEHKRLKHEKPAVPFIEMMAFTKMNAKQPTRGLKNIPTEQLMAHVSQNKRPDESLEQCYQRLKAAETEEQSN